MQLSLMPAEEVLTLPDAPDPQLLSTTLRDTSCERNKQDAVHRWVPWIAGYSSGFVTDTFQQYLPDPARRDVTILEPFSGVGTTLVEGLLHGYNVVGFEVNPFAALASRVKCTAYQLEPEELRQSLLIFEHRARQQTSAIDCAFLAGDDISQCLPAPNAIPPSGFRSRVPFFSPAVERKVLHCLDIIHQMPIAVMREVFLLAFGAVMVRFSNYSFEPSLGSRAGAGKPDVKNADVVGILAGKVQDMLTDVQTYRAAMAQYHPPPTAQLIAQSSLDLAAHLAPNSIDLVVTSPPYLNNYHYIRNTRPHLFWLNFVAVSAEMKRIEVENFGKYWQTVRDGPRAQLSFPLPDLETRIQAIGEQHPEKGVYGGGGWANYAVEYFNDCFRIAQGLRYALKPGAVAVFVLGNSIMQGIELATDRYFGQIGELCGLELEAIHLVRRKRIGNSLVNSSVRNGQPTKATLYEAAVILRQPAR